MSNATVSYDTSSCPANKPASTGTGVMITGTATTSANGSPAPFESMGPSTLQICIIGGSNVDYSNVTLVYTGPATGHFGSQAIHGVVRKVTEEQAAITEEAGSERPLIESRRAGLVLRR